MGSAVVREAIDILGALKGRVGPVSTSADAEQWWPLALSVDASVGVPNLVGGAGRKASSDLLWAVSDAIKTLKRSGEPDIGRVCKAMAELEQQLIGA